MNERTIAALEAAGWTPDRVVDIDKYLKVYKEEKMKMFKKTKEFLKEFGGLSISYQDLTYDRQEYLGFHAEYTAEGWGGLPSSLLENPIGDCWHDCSLTMDRYGRVWLETIVGREFLAKSGRDAIDLIINRKYLLIYY